MIFMIKSIYNYISLFYSVYNLNDEYYKKKKINLKKLDDIILKIKNSGSVIIKFTQWVIPKLELMYCEKDQKPEWLKKMEVLYDDCNIHDLNQTIKEYKKQFNKNLLDNYRVKDVIGSGSIGQVYLIEGIDDNKELVLKITHPNVEKDINTFYFLYKMINKIPYISNLIKFYIPFNIKEFIRSFKKQTDFIEEANNILFFKNKYIDNKFIVIPTLYEISKSIIIMSYEKSQKVEDINISDYELNKIISIFLLFTNESLICTGLNHGDLHKGNWGIRKEDDIYKLVIYDYGFCFNVKLYKNVIMEYYNILDYYDKNNDKDCEYDKLLYLFSNLLINSTEENIKKYMNKNIDKLKYNSMDPYLLAKHFVNGAKENGVIVNHLLIQVFILGIQNELFIEKCGRSKLYREGDKKCKLFECDLTAITFCKTHNVFLEFSKVMETKIKNMEHGIDEIFSGIDFNEDIKKLALQ